MSQVSPNPKSSLNNPLSLSTQLPEIINLLRLAIDQFLQLTRPPGTPPDPPRQSDLDGIALSTLGFSYVALARLSSVCMEIQSIDSGIEAAHQEGRQLSLQDYRALLTSTPESENGENPDEHD
jgi:hypothetical protein